MNSPRRHDLGLQLCKFYQPPPSTNTPLCERAVSRAYFLCNALVDFKWRKCNYIPHSALCLENASADLICSPYFKSRHTSSSFILHLPPIQEEEKRIIIALFTRAENNCLIPLPHFHPLQFTASMVSLDATVRRSHGRRFFIFFCRCWCRIWSPDLVNNTPTHYPSAPKTAHLTPSDTIHWQLCRDIIRVSCVSFHSFGCHSRSTAGPSKLSQLSTFKHHLTLNQTPTMERMGKTVNFH